MFFTLALQQCQRLKDKVQLKYIMKNFSVIFNKNVQSNLYLEVTFGTKKKWSYKTGEFLKDVQLT